MTLEVLGIDHIYIAVSDLAQSTAFYDGVMKLLGFRKGTDPIGGQPHVHYFNRALQYTLRPAKSDAVLEVGRWKPPAPFLKPESRSDSLLSFCVSR